MQKYGPALFRFVVMGFATYGLLYYAYKYYLPGYGGNDFFQYVRMIVSPFDHDVTAPFAYRILNAVLVHLVYRAGIYYPNEIAFQMEGVPQEALFAAMLFNYVCLLLTSMVTMRLVREYAGVRSPFAQLFGGLVLFFSYASLQWVVTGLTEGLSWLMMAAAFLFYLRERTGGVAAILVLSIIQRETIPVIFGVIAAVDLLVQQKPRWFNAQVFVCSVACTVAYVLMRKLGPIPGGEDQVDGGLAVQRTLDFLMLGWAQKATLFQGVLSQNVVWLVLLAGLWQRSLGRPFWQGTYAPHLLAAMAVLLYVGHLGNVTGGNIGRVFSILNPIWVTQLMLFLYRAGFAEPEPEAGERVPARV